MAAGRRLSDERSNERVAHGWPDDLHQRMFEECARAGVVCNESLVNLDELEGSEALASSCLKRRRGSKPEGPVTIMNKQPSTAAEEQTDEASSVTGCHGSKRSWSTTYIRSNSNA